MKTPDEILAKHEDNNEMHFHQVDREWIIEAMEEFALEFAEAAVENWGLTKVSAKDIGAFYDKIIKRDYPKVKWIKCSEALPDNGETVLIYTKRPSINAAELYLLDGEWVGVKKKWPFKEVTHWMPLPNNP